MSLSMIVRDSYNTANSARCMLVASLICRRRSLVSVWCVNLGSLGEAGSHSHRSKRQWAGHVRFRTGYIWAEGHILSGCRATFSTAGRYLCSRVDEYCGCLVHMYAVAILISQLDLYRSFASLEVTDWRDQRRLNHPELFWMMRWIPRSLTTSWAWLKRAKHI